MTEKLYYKDAYIREFSATVISCDKCECGYDIVLDKTAFFPEAGGQTSDKGHIGCSKVIDVKEIGDEIHHYVESLVNVNETLLCTIDFEERFDKMQCHTAEHIISGLFHKLYGVENTGFHLGAVEVTFDTSLVMTKEQLDHVEILANKAIMENRKITAYFPDEETLKSLTYRSKLELTENVRIVDIDGYDSCACCAPHVNFTGEIGMIKILDAVKHKGGSRIRMLAGMRAYKYMSTIAKEAAAVSVLLSAPQTEISKEVERVLSVRDGYKNALAEKEKALALSYAKAVDTDREFSAYYYPELSMDALREFVNEAGDSISGTLVAITGTEGDLKYIIKSTRADLSSIVKEANAALSGKGGGRPPMAQGTYCATPDEVIAYFNFKNQ